MVTTLPKHLVLNSTIYLQVIKLHKTLDIFVLVLSFKRRNCLDEEIFVITFISIIS